MTQTGQATELPPGHLVGVETVCARPAVGRGTGYTTRSGAARRSAPAPGATGSRSSARRIAHVVAVAADTVGSPLRRSTSSSTSSERICTHAERTSASQPRRSRPRQCSFEVVRIERGDCSVLGDLEADRVSDLDARVLDVRDDELRELLEIGRDDPDPARAERMERVDERARGRDDGRSSMLLLENRFDLRLCRAVAPRALRHDRDQARGGDDVRPQVRELRRRAFGLLVHGAQPLGRHVLHPQACAVEGERVLRPCALAGAQKRGDLGLHRRVRARHEQPDPVHRAHRASSDPGVSPERRRAGLPRHRRGRRRRSRHSRRLRPARARRFGSTLSPGLE